MMRHNSVARLTLALLAVLALAGLAAAETREKQVPFRGRLEAVATVTPLTPPFVSINVEGSGHATQLGHFEVSIPHVTNRSNGTAIGTYEFTAANGDTLTADFTSQVTPTDVPGVVSVAVTATITGGTGRFDGATGSFDAERVVDMVHGTVTESFDGTISSPGASKR
jgi:hypothetical protein